MTACALLPFSVTDDPFAVLMDPKKGLKVLQFADLHFGEEGAAYHNADVTRTLDFIEYAIESEAHDFIVARGYGGFADRGDLRSISNPLYLRFRKSR